MAQGEAEPSLVKAKLAHHFPVPSDPLPPLIACGRLPADPVPGDRPAADVPAEDPITNHNYVTIHRTECLRVGQSPHGFLQITDESEKPIYLLPEEAGVLIHYLGKVLEWKRSLVRPPSFYLLKGVLFQATISDVQVNLKSRLCLECCLMSLRFRTAP